MDKFKELFTSKKFWLTILGTIVVNIMVQLGISHDIVLAVAGLFGINILGTSAVDVMKEKKK